MSKSASTPKPNASPAPLWRLAEILQMRREATFSATSSTIHYTCQLCGGRSVDEHGEIEHKSYCPVVRLKG